MADSKRLVLVDGSSYLYRAFHVPNLQRLTNSAGEPTGAVYGVLNMLHKLIGSEEPERIAIVFDASGKNFRHEIYPEYKANRPPMPDELRGQLEPLFEAVEALGLPLLRVSGVEADDVIGTLARQASESGVRTLISTGDKDMAQLVDDRTTLVDTMKGVERDPAKVLDKFGVRPDQIIDYLALVGDSSDNIPGVPGVGPKTAAKWLGLYEHLDGISAHADEIKGKVGENLRAHLEQLDLARELATIDRTSTWTRARTTCAAPARRRAPARALRAARAAVPAAAAAVDDGAPSAPAEATRRGPDYETVPTTRRLRRLAGTLGAADLFAFDTETDQPRLHARRHRRRIVCRDAGRGRLRAAGPRLPGAPDQLDRDAVLERCSRCWKIRREQGRPPPEVRRARAGNHGIELAGMRYDTMLESYVLNSTATRHDMDSLALKYLGVETTHYEDVAGKGAKQLTFNQVAIETPRPTPPRMRTSRCSCTRPVAAARRRPSLLRVYGTSRCRWCRCCADGAHRRADRRQMLRSQSRSSPRHAASSRSRPTTPPAALQPRLAQAAAGDPVRAAGPAGDPQDAQGPALDRGRRAAGTGRRTTSCQR